jgi:hypothetical protein
MTLLTQNAKMKKSSQNGNNVFNFGIPAFRSETGLATCPNASQCATGCYARTGTYRFKNTVNAYETRLSLTQTEDFVPLLVADIHLKSLQSKSKGLQCIIRIHDSGDFYSKDYAKKWFAIMAHFENNPNVSFYAYTKMVSMFETFKAENIIPSNFRAIYSYGGREDSQIDTESHKHSRVFENLAQLLQAGYADASQDDMVAYNSLKVGLVYHGVKSYQNTTWSKVV